MAQFSKLPFKSTRLTTQASRGYFSFMDRVKAKINVPMKHRALSRMVKTPSLNSLKATDFTEIHRIAVE